MDPVWDTVRMNNVMGHFATAYFNYYLKGDVSMLLFPDVHPDERQCMRKCPAEKTHNAGPDLQRHSRRRKTRARSTLSYSIARNVATIPFRPVAGQDLTVSLLLLG